MVLLPLNCFVPLFYLQPRVPYIFSQYPIFLKDQTGMAIGRNFGEDTLAHWPNGSSDETLDSNWESELIVPDDGCRLVHASACVYIDPYGSWYVKYIDSTRLRFVHHDVSQRLCSAFHIRKLSDVVVEELDREEHLQTLEEVGSVSLAVIRHKLLSSSFQVDVSNVLNTVPNTTGKFKIPDFPTLQKSFESIAQNSRLLYLTFWFFKVPLYDNNIY